MARLTLICLVIVGLIALVHAIADDLINDYDAFVSFLEHDYEECYGATLKGKSHNVLCVPSMINIIQHFPYVLHDIECHGAFMKKEIDLFKNAQDILDIKKFLPRFCKLFNYAVLGWDDSGKKVGRDDCGEKMIWDKSCQRVADRLECEEVRFMGLLNQDIDDA